MLRVAIFFVAASGAVAQPGDPPPTPPVRPKVNPTFPDKVDRDKSKRPTTPSEFAGLASEGPFPPWIRDKNEVLLVIPGHMDGTVLEVSADKIKIGRKGKEETATYTPHTLLATGGVCHWQDDPFCYLLDDVRVGDEVILGVGTVDKDKGPECFYLSIRWRPNAKVPASRKPDETKPYHKKQQYQNEYDDRGEHTPEELQSHEDYKKLCEKRGMLPPPPLKPKIPRVKADAPPVKKD